MTDQRPSSFEPDPTHEGVSPSEEPRSVDESIDDEDFIRGNRPANDAPQATPGSVFDKEWKGQPGATDFLGLDQDLTNETDTPASAEGAERPDVPQGFASAGSGTADSTGSSVTPAFDEEAPPLDAAYDPDPGRAQADGDEYDPKASWFMSPEAGEARADEPEAEGGAAHESAAALAAELANEGIEGDAAAASWFEEEPQSSVRRYLPKIAASFFVGVLGTCGYLFWSESQTSSTEAVRPRQPAPGPTVAKTPEEPELVRPAPEGGQARALVGREGGRAAPGGEATGVEREPPPSPPRPSASSGARRPTPPEVAGQQPGGSPRAGERAPQPGARGGNTGEALARANTRPGGTGEPKAAPRGARVGPGLTSPGQGAGPTPAGDPPPPGPAGVGQRSTRIRPEDLVVTGEDLTGLRAASADDLAAVWPNETIPEEYLRGDRKVLTPAVGRVRVILQTDDVFEGRLYAIGLNTLWLEGVYGRMGLSGERVASLSRITSGEGAPVLGGTGSETMTGLDRVRINAKGGAFFAKVISQEGDKTIVITDGGARLTLANEEIEFLGRNPEIVIKSRIAN